MPGRYLGARLAAGLG